MKMNVINDINSEELKRQEIKTNLDINTFVEAGAGAGKTSILVTRIMNQIKSGRWTVDQLVAITFTNKAAQELKERIGFRLREEYHKAEGETKVYLGKALRNLDRMQISTIHSFCFKLLMEQIFCAGLRMDMCLLADDDAAEKKYAHFHNWYRNLPYTVIKNFKDNFVGASREKALENAFNIICELDDNVIVEYDKHLLNNDIDHYEKVFRKKRNKYMTVLLEELDKETEGKCQSLMDAINAGAVYKGFVDLINETNNDKEFVVATCTEKVKALKACSAIGINTVAAKEINDAAREEAYIGFDAESFSGEMSAYQNALLIDLALDCRREYRKLFDHQEITNDMLLIKARDLVVNNADARAAFSKKYRCIYVDEFQDTDHVQTELLLALCTGDDGNLRPGSIFVVGDPKQSIYRFRGADLPLYNETRDSLKDMPGCKFFSLNYNFRSNEEIVGFVNKNNKEIIDRYEAMVSMADKSDGNVPGRLLSGVYHIGSPNALCKGYNGSKDVQELANIISKLVDNKVNIWDKIKGIHRPIEYRDFLVLCYSTMGMEKYMAELLNRGIPVQISGAVDFSGKKELRRFITLYNFLAFPQYKRIREAAGQCLMHCIINKKNVIDADEKLQRLLDETRNLDGAGCALYLSRHLEYLLDSDVEIDANGLVRLQAQLQQMAEAVMSEFADSRQEMANAFTDYLEEKVDRELTLREDSNTVRFMNVHKAKGLEGNIVIVCKRSEKHVYKESSYQEKGSDGKYHIYPSVSEPWGQFSSITYSAYSNKPSVKEKSLREEMQEYNRLDYVEGTRAIEAIIFLNALGKNAGFIEYDFSESKHLYGELEEIFDYSQEEQPEVEKEAVIYETDRCDVMLEEGQSEIQYWKLSPSDLERTVYLSRGEISSDSGDGNDERPKGNLFGTAMHRCFELMIARLQRGEKDMAAQEQAANQTMIEIMEDLREAFDFEAEKVAKLYLEYLKKLLPNFVDDKRILGVIGSDAKVYTEFPFSMYISKKSHPEVFDALYKKLPASKLDRILPTDEYQKIWVNGKADLVAVRPDGNILVIDYKSDWSDGLPKDVFTQVIEEKYGGQMELYRQMLSIVFDVKPDNIKGEFYLID